MAGVSPGWSAMTDPSAIIGLMGASALVVAALVARLPVGTCQECPHCRAQAARDEEVQRRLRTDYERSAGIPRDPRDHDDDGMEP